MLHTTRYGSAINLVTVPAARLDDLIAAVQRHNPDVLHLSGYGEEGDGFLFRTDDGGQAPVKQQALSDLLAVAAPQLRLALVNACWGASLAQLLANTTGCAIGSTTIVDDETARRFSLEFYRAMGNGFSAGDSFRITRHALATYDLPDQHALNLFQKSEGTADRIFVIPGALLPAPARDAAAKPSPPTAPASRRKYRAVITGDARDEEEARSMMAGFTVEMMTFTDDRQL
ncbi:hypothetical protein ACGFII_31720 [Micromonospora chalcea]